uniref:Tensin 3 n=1 Tax=Lates calcarifer TaxID=8187 RepID=A0A4W6FAN1_LATCA
MEELRRIDLTYITERIITIFCPPECPEETYLQNLQEIIPMLQSKHGHNYMLINLSQKNGTLTQMNHKVMVLDTGWVDRLAPCLDQILSVCTTMENWLQTNLKHVLVLHCRGGKGRLGVLVASYIHFNNMSASADLSLDHFAMRRFYNDKLSALMTPSQKRYVWMLGSMLKGGLRMCPSPSFLLCVVLHGLPKIRVVCYDKDSRSGSRQVVFCLQFHTGLVHGHTLTFSKADLDCASEDPRFPDDGKVELLLSESPEKITGRRTPFSLFLKMKLVATASCITQQRENTQADHSDFVFPAPPHVLGPGNGSLYARVRKRSSEEGVSFPPLIASSPSCSDRAPSASSDSGLSVASQGRTGARPGRGATQDKCTQAGKLLSGLEFEIAQPLLEVMTELAACGGGEVGMVGDKSGLGHTLNGEASSRERETDILDDEDEVDNVANLPETQRSPQTEYCTRSWVQQQQMVEVVTDNYLQVDGKERSSRARKERPPPLVAPDTPPRGISSREAVQRGLVDEDGTHNATQNAQSAHTTHNSSIQEDDLESLTTDVDESIEQLNQLILDLDPTFVPVPTRCAPLSRSASLHTNGLSHKGNTHLSGKTNQTLFNNSSLSHYDRLKCHAKKNTPVPTRRLAAVTPSLPQHSQCPQFSPGGSEKPWRRQTDGQHRLVLVVVGNGGLDHSLLEAMEGLGTLNLGGEGGLAPLLPEKRRWGEGGELGSRSPSLSGFSSPHSGSSLSIPFSFNLCLADSGSKQDTVKFVQDTSKFWYKPDISRDQAITVLKDKEPGSFIVRDSHSFRGAYGLAMKVATPPPSVLQQSKKVGDLSNELVRHFLIECTQKGVRLKGCPNEPYFGSLTALVCQHSITPLALPCKLILPDKDPVEELSDSSAQTATNSAAELLKQGAACNVWYLGSVALESLTGHQAVQKATTMTLSMDPPPASTVVHFKVSAQGITLTDNQRKLFFRRHYAVNTVIFCSLDPQGRKIFGFVARKSQSETENMCHLFAEHDPEQPASAIVNFVSKVMIGSHKK